MRRLYKNYIRMCARRNVFWNVTIEEFHRLTSLPCHYCSKKPSQKARHYTYNGLDRLDPKKGYELPNLVPCCKECNWIKGDRLAVDEMQAVGKMLAEFRAKKKG